jgi:type I restriction enzyme S subunit
MVLKETAIGLVPEEWQVKTIDEIKARQPHALAMGPFGSNITSNNFIPSGVPVIRGVNLSTYRFKNSDFVYLSEAKADELKSSNASPKDIVVTHRGTLGQVGIIPENDAYHRYVISQSQMKLTCDEKIANPEFVFYYLKSPIGQRQLLINTSTTGVPAIAQPLSSLRRILVPLPSLDEQSAIAETLKSLDTKIGINERLNLELETLGKIIFKHWFVDFEFPNEEGKPYKSSGGEMVESEKAEIPKGWSTTELKKLGSIVCGKTPPKANKEYFGGKVPFIKIPDMHSQLFIINTEDSLTDEGERYQTSKNVPANSICVSCIATVGLVSITSRQSQTNQQINCIVPHEEFYMPYLFYTMKSLKKELEDLGSGGSATFNVNTNTFSNIRIIDPKTEIVKEFYRIVEPLLLKLRANLIENHMLSQIRDSLLPKLMSGKIRVPVQKNVAVK